MSTALAEFRLDPELKAEVVAMLRDPEARQGHNMLRNEDDGVCCLEKFCQVAIKHEVIPPPRLRHGDWFYGNENELNKYYLPSSVATFFKFFTDDGRPVSTPVIPVSAALGYHDRNGGGMDYPLSILNDEHLLTFPQIADLIDYFF